MFKKPVSASTIIYKNHNYQGDSEREEEILAYLLKTGASVVYYQQSCKRGTEGGAPSARAKISQNINQGQGAEIMV